jgi:hypothetical protein
VEVTNFDNLAMYGVEPFSSKATSLQLVEIPGFLVHRLDAHQRGGMFLLHTNPNGSGHKQ